MNDNENAIGYVGFRYVADAGENVKTLSIKTPRGDVVPSEETVKSGKYLIAQPLLFYVKNEAVGNVKAFIDFCLSADGQKIVGEIGYMPITK
ncbi:MAG: substrate-binding domain-containing protein [Planctomycetes bacterium]|nr:substrate-binding domain-containing protein [Planctomycetota bacterium]